MGLKQILNTFLQKVTVQGFRVRYMIIESVGVITSTARHEELGRGLLSLLGPMRVEAGCLECRLFRDFTNPNAFQLETYWNTEDDLTRHVRSAVYKKLLFLMEMGAEPPTIEFHEVCQTRGLEFIQTVRQV
jgi:quinol monooxygenase YgiN